jgi:hypothetical protein
MASMLDQIFIKNIEMEQYKEFMKGMRESNNNPQNQNTSVFEIGVAQTLTKIESQLDVQIRNQERIENLLTQILWILQQNAQVQVPQAQVPQAQVPQKK